MFGAPTRYGARPGARYRDVDVAARVEGADAHGLIVILYEELLKAIDTLAACERSGERGRAGPAQSRALSILHGLESGLDHARGEEVAANLARVYREARRLVMTAAGPGREPALGQARAMVGELAAAWITIG